LPAESRIAGLHVRHPQFTAIPKWGATSNPERIARAVLPLVRMLHAQSPFAVVDAQFFFPDGPAAAIVARVLGLPLAIKARGSDIHFWSTRPRALEQMIEAARQAAGMLAVSQALRRDMIALGMPGERIAVHYTGLDRERFHSLERKAARALVSAIPGLGIWSEGPLILTPGALIALKGQRLAIEALARIPEAVLALAGAGADEAALRALAARLGVKERVNFLGQVSHELLPQLFSAADVVVLPSEREGLANVWIEALACGTPLVIPDVGGAREVVSDAAAGRIVAREPEAIATAVREILEDPPAQAEVAAQAAAFSWEANAAQLAAFWRRLAEGHPPVPTGQP
jgi:glycosyltransferase involved in cell wall biosynthesis